MNYKKENSRLQYKATLKAIYQLFDRPVKQPRSKTTIKSIQEVYIGNHTIEKLVDNNILVKVTRTEYTLKVPRKKLWNLMERL